MDADHHPLLDAVDLHGAHDFRHTFSTWLEDAGIPARVIDELMGHQASGRSGRHQASAMGAHYRHTTPRWPPAWWLRSKSAWSSWRRRRLTPTNNPGDAPRWSGHCASFAGGLLADDAQSRLERSALSSWRPSRNRDFLR